MTKLRPLNDDDLEIISNFLYDNAYDFILKRVKIKEIQDISIDIGNTYENEQLDVAMSINLELDALSNQNPSIINEAIHDSLEKLEEFLDDNFRS